jgi:hypothetical protein
MRNLERALRVESNCQSQLIAKLLGKSAAGETIRDAGDQLSTLLRI